jgi:hypothetical protein
MGGRQDLAHHVEHGVVVERVSDLLQLLVQPLKDAPSIVLVATKLKIRQSFRWP